MIHTQKIRELHLTPGTSESRSPFISAASGLVKVNNLLYVVADDEHHLGLFSPDPAQPGELVRLLEGTLPDKPKARKKKKPEKLPLNPVINQQNKKALQFIARLFYFPRVAV